MAVKMKLEGGGDIERALGELARGTSKGVMRRAMKKALQPVADDGEANSGGKFRVSVTSKLSGRPERGDRGKSVVTMYVGPDAKDSPHAHLYEDGTVDRFHRKTHRWVGAMPSQPFMRPAWDANREKVLETLRREVWAEIEKSVERARRKAAKAAG